MECHIPIVSPVINKVYHYVVPKKAPPSIIERVWLAACRAIYRVIDALDRIRDLTDGLDKVLKLLSSLAVGACLFSFLDKAYFTELGKELREIDGVFSAVSVFGRLNALTKLGFNAKSGKYERTVRKEGPFKEANVSFLTISKFCEFGRLLQRVGFLSTQWLVQADAQYLGGVVARVGGSSVFGRAAFEIGLRGFKEFFLVIASTYAIINSAITVIDCMPDSKGGYFDVQRAAVSIGADAGKIYLATAAFAVAPLWVAVAFLTAVFSLSKILMDSYKEQGGVKYPAWMLKA